MYSANSLLEGNPVPDDECWYRVIINTRHITAAGTIHHSAFAGSAIARIVDKPWSHEISGRLASLSGDPAAIMAEGTQRVANARRNYAATHNGITSSSIIFSGFACAKVHELRKTLNNTLRIDVIYTPLIDEAHSDLVAIVATNDADIDILKAWLLTQVRAIRLHNINFLLTSCGVVTPSPPPPRQLTSAT